MAMNEAALKEKLMNENPDFARLAHQHQSYDEELQKLVKQPFLTPEEQIKETQLKKMKLKLKDQMARMLIAAQVSQ